MLAIHDFKRIERDVPIVGQREVKIHDIAVNVVVQCPCADDAPPVLIRNFDHAPTCPKCGTQMVITALAYQHQPEMRLSVSAGMLRRVQLPTVPDNREIRECT